MTRLPRFRWSRLSPGFTLIELLTVVAILGVLAAIVIPTTTGARNSARRARTRVQFSQWAAAYEAFRQEYGAYPQVAGDGELSLVNQGAVADPAGRHPFHDQLAGTRRDGSALGSFGSGAAASMPTENSRQIHFFTFAESDLVSAADVSAGLNAPGELNLIRDAFHNTAIAVVADGNLDGVINSRDAPAGLPAVPVPGSSLAIRPKLLAGTNSSGAIHAGVIFYSAPPGATSEEDLIMSWR